MSGRRAWGRARGARRWVQRRPDIVLPAPALLLLAGMSVVPVAYTLYLSFHEWSLSSVATPRFVGLRTYAALLVDPVFHHSLRVTFWYTLGGVVFQLAVGLGVALLFHRPFRGRGLARTILLMPWVATPVAVAVVWAMLFQPDFGVLNQLLRALGLPPSLWIASSATVLPSLILVEVWKWTPLVVLVLLAGLASLPTEPFESARVDGASPWQSFWHVTLPLLRPSLAAAAIIRTIDTLRIFDTILVLTEGGPNNASETLNLLAYHQGFVYYRMGDVSALLVVFVTIVFLVSLALIRLRREPW